MSGQLWLELRREMQQLIRDSERGVITGIYPHQQFERILDVVEKMTDEAMDKGKELGKAKAEVPNPAPYIPRLNQVANDYTTLRLLNGALNDIHELKKEIARLKANNGTGIS